MNKTNENASQVEAQQDVIELGTASAETLGGGGPRFEPLGFFLTAGLAED